jgi:hypothetical protein
MYTIDTQGLTVSRDVSDDPKSKEKENETFAKGVTSVGRFGRYVRIRCYPEDSPSGHRADAAVPTQASKLQLVIESFKRK